MARHDIDRACHLPEPAGRSLSQWDCTALARRLVREGIVAAIAPQTSQRLLARCRLKPWRSHRWLHPRTVRDAAFVQCVHELADLSTRPLAPWERVLCLDELTSLQPRPRRAPTRPARPGDPVQLDHEDQRDGALQLFAAFDTRSGQVYARPFRRKRPVECIAFLDHLDRSIPAPITTVHLVCDNVSVHHGTAVRARLADHPRFVLHFTPVHRSWMNQVEIELSVLASPCLDRRLPDRATLAREVAAWEQARTAAHHTIDWRFTTTDARIKLKHLFPAIQD